MVSGSIKHFSPQKKNNLTLFFYPLITRCFLGFTVQRENLLQTHQTFWNIHKIKRRTLDLCEKQKHHRRRILWNIGIYVYTNPAPRRNEKQNPHLRTDCVDILCGLRASIGDVGLVFAEDNAICERVSQNALYSQLIKRTHLSKTKYMFSTICYVSAMYVWMCIIRSTLKWFCC